MFKGFAFYSIITLLLMFSFSLGYFILVNTILADNVLPNIKINSQDVSLLSESDLETKIFNEAVAGLPEFIEIHIDGYKHKVATSTIELELANYNLVDYGKGKDFLKVISEAVNAVTGQINVELTFTADVSDVLYNSQLDFKSSIYSKVVNNQFECIQNRYNEQLDSIYILEQLNNGIKQGLVYLEGNKLFLNEAAKQVYSGCNKFFEEKDLLESELSKYKIGNLEDYILLVNNGGRAEWRIMNNETELFNKISNSIYVEALDGKYELVGDKIYLYEQYQEGYKTTPEIVKSSLINWLKDPKKELEIETQKTSPNILTFGKEIIDFTNLIGEGKSRIDLIRNGAPNFIVAYTQYGLEEIDYLVIEPGREFSYIDFIQPNNGMTKSGRPIAPGICNSTTTLFRAILESGLKVTDRSYHAFYVPSYEWGYPYNIVDAAYFTNPDVDFKFKNDTDFPILIKVEFSRDSDYQYNTVKIYTSSEAPKRDVEITNWKIWDKYSKTNFKGSFDRVIKVFC